MLLSLSSFLLVGHSDICLHSKRLRSNTGSKMALQSPSDSGRPSRSRSPRGSTVTVRSLDMESDLDVDVEIGRCRKKSIRCPSTLEQIMAWPHRLAEDLRASHQALFSRAQDKLSRGVVLTSSYSGMGTVELAGAMLKAAFSPDRGSVIVYSVCDASPQARKVLLSHRGPTRARHVFSDIMHYVPKHDRRTLERITNKHCSEWLALKTKRPPLSPHELRHHSSCIGESLRCELLEVLESTQFPEKAYCDVHCDYCSLDPMQDPALRGHYHFDIGGNTCTPWSSMGEREGWISLHTMHVLVWACHARYRGAHGVLSECTPYFPAQVLHAQVFANRSPKVPRCPRAHHFPYVFHSEIMSPVDMGIPTSRPRRWSFWWQATDRSLMVDSGKTLEALYFVDSLACNGSVFLVAPQKMISEDTARRGQAMTKLTKDQWEALDISHPEAAMPPVLHLRVSEYRELAAEKCLVKDNQWKVGFCLCDLSQRPDFARNLQTRHIMAFRRNSIFHDLVSARPMLIEECFLAMGFPVPGLVSPKTSAHFPFPEIFKQLSRDALTNLVGNAMAVPAVGASLCYLLIMS